MKWVLTEPGRIRAVSDTESEYAEKPGWVRLRVQYCGICRTDAKMWREGHRDLVFPRVPGHEVCAEDASGKRFAVWPGRSCGQCRYCLTGRENLCDAMEIMGFHVDGGFSRFLLAPMESLIPVDAAMSPHLVCFAEPVGCVIHAVESLHLKQGERLAIFGGGTLGLAAALAARQNGAVPLVIEKNPKKIERAQNFLDLCGIFAATGPGADEFDAAITACPDPAAFGDALSGLAKGGRFSFFSGLAKDAAIQTQQLNLFHYREISLFGAYGLTRRHMEAALSLIADQAPAFSLLVEKIVSPDALGEQFPLVLKGEGFRRIVDLTG
ncbi:alcohol dehydrogenase catalytic domain-containing protein [Desulfosarcina sp. OttesenSCG-928-A07]|nr:alcohol dehydrogenase catalytic domain-containing protein [Desulfosarcina sp. OttesenSCG-928-G17]MDL2328294.1 alcohol dehydrogenase catalytic domain-containing protein [Desulfosarcina sp. OttesenSCG-928-A07]